jgi:hypothetical protein
MPSDATSPETAASLSHHLYNIEIHGPDLLNMNSTVVDWIK